MTASKHTKNPQMEVYFKEQDKNKVNKIVSYIKYTTIEHLKTNISIYYEDEINNKDSFIFGLMCLCWSFLWCISYRIIDNFL